jgi:RIO kinase 1
MFLGNIVGDEDIVSLMGCGVEDHSALYFRFLTIEFIFVLTGKSNPRKMVKVWAEKEMRNYRRIHAAGIPCPQPIFLKSHILIMEFLGEEGWPSPRLKDAALGSKHMREAYVQTILIMRHLYQRCKLVHGDLSEYNLLWHNSQIFVIDVSQSVENTHPSALDFLRKDASNVNDYFSKMANLNVMTTRQLFEFTTTPMNGGDEEEMESLERFMVEVEQYNSKLSESSAQEVREYARKEASDEAVFMSSFLPRSLNQVAEYDIHKLEKGDVEETYAHAVAALTGNPEELKKLNNNADGDLVELQGEDSTNDDEEGGGSSDEDESDDEDYQFVKTPRSPEELEAEKNEKRAGRKANKKAVREVKTEKRETKIKKKDKKRAIKRAKAGNKNK